ncbi:hypothetical protein Rs2_03060 [Raphanus sativus]|nr:hypothetical protein Rs2_03060 [Raphanus sativus]
MVSTQLAASSQGEHNREVLICNGKTVATSHHGGVSSNIAPPVHAFSQNIENHSAAVPYQSTPLAVGGSQVLLPPSATVTHLPENGSAQNTVSREELNHISNISASLAQFFGNGQLQSTLNPKQAMQVPQVYGKEEKIDHYLSAYKPKLTKLVQAYISKVKKS